MDRFNTKELINILLLEILKTLPLIKQGKVLSKINLDTAKLDEESINLLEILKNNK